MHTTADRPTPSQTKATAAPATAALAIEAVSHAFGPTSVLDGLDLQVEAGEVVAIVGPSGCGKSTLLELVAGLGEPDRGRIRIGGATAAPDRLARSAYMPQRDLLLPWLRAIDNAALGLRLSGSRAARARELAQPTFERLGLAGFERSRPAQLSGGMRQRVAFARTLLTGKPLLLLDEPLAALDAITRADLQSWLGEVLAAEPRTVILVTHDVEEALFVGDRVVALSARPGRAVWTGSKPPSAGARRDQVVTDPQFVALREAALRALGGTR